MFCKDKAERDPDFATKRGGNYRILLPSNELQSLANKLLCDASLQVSPITMPPPGPFLRARPYKTHMHANGCPISIPHSPLPTLPTLIRLLHHVVRLHAYSTAVATRTRSCELLSADLRRGREGPAAHQYILQIPTNSTPNTHTGAALGGKRPRHPRAHVRLLRHAHARPHLLEPRPVRAGLHSRPGNQCVSCVCARRKGLQTLIMLCGVGCVGLAGLALRYTRTKVRAQRRTGTPRTYQPETGTTPSAQQHADAHTREDTQAMSRIP